jgi:poly-gamma-glutamate capsule biosynthesis protein CapA/YwtB (metallophosphatase superfamily)
MKRMLSWITFGLLAIVLTACLSAALPASLSSPTPHSSESSLSPSPPASKLPTTSVSPSEPAMPAEPEQWEATLLAVGDIMVHMPQLPAYYDAASKRYEFSSWFTPIKPLLQTGDWVIGNLETPVAGKDLKYTGYPRFNAPIEILEALKGAGVQLLSTANNHSMDRGFPGIQRTLKNIRKAGIIPIGTSASVVDQHKTVIEERNGIRMGFLAYTYGTNGIPVSADKLYSVNLINRPVIAADIARLRQAEVDVVTVSLHFGIEYQRMPSEIQTSLARELVRAGADIILGSHPHVVQPYEEIEIPASESYDGTSRRGIVIYSLGNFISNQTGSWKDVGLVFGLHLIKTRMPDGTSSTKWDRIMTEPTWVHILSKNQKRYYTIIPLRSALESKNIPDLTAGDYSKMNILLSGLNKHLHQLQAK